MSSRTRAVLVVIAILTGLLGVLAPRASAATTGPLVWGVNPHENGAFPDEFGLQPFNAATGANADGGNVITITGGPVTGTVLGANGLAVDPTGPTTYVILQVQSVPGRVLATINLATGQATTIANTGQNIAGITFTTAGVLYAVTGDNDGTCGACLYQINKADGVLTHVKTLDTELTGGEAIAFNPDDGMVYHTSGWDGEAVFQKIDPQTPPFTPIDIPYIGTPPDEILGLGYDPDTDTFLATDWDFVVHSITPGGTITELGDDVTEPHRGLVVAPDPTDPVAVNDSLTVARNSGFTELTATDNDIDGTITPVGQIASVTQPTNGDAEVRSLGTAVAYRPDTNYCNEPGFAADDVFTYTLDSGSTAQVLVKVTCPTVARTITLKYSSARNTFKGTLASAEPLCVSTSSQVDISKVDKNNNFLAHVATVFTEPDGTYKFKQRAKRARYQARVFTTAVPNTAFCSSAESNTIKVRTP